MFRWFPFLACALIACGRPSVKVPPATAPDRPDGVAVQVRRAVEPLFEHEVLHGGMVVALIEPSRDNGVTYLGFGEKAPTEDAIFEIGSASKVLTALLLSDAVSRGEVTLDTPVAQLLPLGVRFPDKDGVAATLGQLASHRAGLAPLPANLDPTAPDPYAKYGERDLYAYLERAQLMFTPGTAFQYSNLGAALLGHVLAKKIGMSYEQAVTTRILAPLGLKETWMHLPDAAKPRLLSGNSAGGDPVQPWSFGVFAPAGAWRSTPRDMVHLVKTAADAAAGKDVPLGDVLRRSFEPLGESFPEMEVGLGWLINDAGIIWHNGLTGGQSSFLGFDPKTGKGVVVLATTQSMLVTRIGIGVFEAYAGKELDLGLDLVDVPVAELDKLVGHYRASDGTVLEVVRKGGGLALTGPNGSVRLFPRSPTKFVILEIESIAEFVIENGKVLGFVWHLPGGDEQLERLENTP